MENESTRPFKKAKTFDEQIDILKKRKLIIGNEEEAKIVLATVNYYRFSGYFRYYYKYGREEFKEGSSFEEIYDLYKFDTELRRLCMELTEEVEIKFRTHIAYYIAHNFGEYGHLEKDNFYNEKFHDSFMETLKNKIISFKDKEYIKHHKEIYDGKIPIWVVVEILSFTDLSKLYSNMKDHDRKKIVRDNYTDLDVVNNSNIVRNWIQSLLEVRNICAHYERLYDSKFSKYIKLPKQYKDKNIKANSLFAHLIIFKLLIDDDKLWDRFMERFDNIISKYKFEKLGNMGFIENWREILVTKKD
ncbi:MAG: Abi family protein [Peptostreptococcaceae bacterium]|nr:Abi family protein [Peptostreptococcaceae bacterium]